MSRGVELLLNNHSYFYFISSGLIELQAGWVFPVPEESCVCEAQTLFLLCWILWNTNSAALAQRAEQEGMLGFASTGLSKLSLNSH